MPRRRIHLLLVLVTTLASCNKPQAPTSPSPVATVVEPTVYLEVKDNSCCNKSGITSEIPWAAYSYCATLYITGGANSIKFTETLTVFAEDGELMFTTNFGGNVQTLAAGIVRVGCGGGAEAQRRQSLRPQLYLSNRLHLRYGTHRIRRRQCALHD